MAKDTTSIGKMDQRIIIQKPVTVRSNSGAAVNTFSAIHVLWADVQDTRGDEGLTNDKITSTANMVFITRYVSGLNTKMRVSYEGEIYNIRSIVRETRKKYLIIRADKHE